MLYANHCGIGAEGAVAVAEALRRMDAAVQMAHLIGNKTGAESIVAVAEAVRGVDARVEMLDLKDNDVDDGARARVQEMLAEKVDFLHL